MQCDTEIDSNRGKNEAQISKPKEGREAEQGRRHSREKSFSFSFPLDICAQFASSLWTWTPRSYFYLCVFVSNGYISNRRRFLFSFRLLFQPLFAFWLFLLLAPSSSSSSSSDRRAFELSAQGSSEMRTFISVLHSRASRERFLCLHSRLIITISLACSLFFSSPSSAFFASL